MSFSIKFKLFIVFLYGYTWAIQAQKYPSQNISITEGLPNNQIEAIFKDSRGFLWIGTQNGLARIDNNSMTSYFVEDGLSNNAVWAIKEDPSGNLWFGTYGGGITKFDGENFIPITHNTKLSTSLVRKLFIHNNHLLIGTEQGLFILDFATEEIIELETHHDKFQIMDFVLYKNEVYIATYQKGVFKLNEAKNKLTLIRTFDTFDRDSIFSLNLVNDSLLVGNNANGVTTRIINAVGALDKYGVDDFLNKGSYTKTFGKSIVWDYQIDKRENHYVACWSVNSNSGGLYKVVKDRFINVSADYGIESHQIRRLYYDEDFDQLYVGTQDKGLYILNLDQTIRFTATPNYQVSNFGFFNDALVFLTDRGIEFKNDDRIDVISKTKLLSILKSFNRKRRPEYVKALNANIKPKNLTLHTLKMHNQSLWVTSIYGLFEIDEQTKIHYYSTGSELFEFDDKDLLSLNPYSFVTRYTDIKAARIYDYSSTTSETNTFYHYRYKYDSINNPIHITNLVKNENVLYLSSPLNGLYRYENKVFKSLYHSGDFIEKEITHLAFDTPHKTLAISNNAGKVFLVDVRADFKIKSVINKTAYIGNALLFIETYKGAVLIGTEAGINIFNGAKHQFIDSEQGVDLKNFIKAKIIENTLYLSTIDGYYTINMDAVVQTVKPPPRISLSAIKINDSTYVKSKQKWFTQAFSGSPLSYDENNMQLKFTSVNHPYPKKLEYAYQIKGLDNSWVTTESQNQINLRYLPKGKFTVNLKVNDLSTGTSSVHKLAAIKILPPYWKTWWFYSFILLISGLIIMLIYKKRVSIIQTRELEKAKIEKRITETKLEALGSQMNPHFTFNALNSIQNYIIDNDVDNALMYLSEFAKLIRKTFDNSSLQLISLSEEISYLKSYVILENMRFNNRVAVHFDYSALEIDAIDLPPMLIQPFIENVFVHAFEKSHPNPKLNISFVVNGSVLNCIIEDNGLGMGQSQSGQLHQSKGLKLLKERLDLLDTSLSSFFTVNSEKGKGTTITLNLDIAEFDD